MGVLSDAVGAVWWVADVVVGGAPDRVRFLGGMLMRLIPGWALDV